jgi:hypothetical protein
MQRFEGDGHSIAFDDRWSVAIKWDDSPAYKKGVGVVQQSCAVDYVATRGTELYLIEAKAYSDAKAEIEQKGKTAELADWIGQKVRDTVSGLVGAARMGEIEDIKACAKILLNSKQNVHVLVWILEPKCRPGEPQSKRDMRTDTRRKQIISKLLWLTPRQCVQICDPARANLSHLGIEVKRLPAG